MTPDDFRRFVAMVAEMRKRQQDYFRLKCGLTECKAVERAVDRWIVEHRSTGNQRSLFESEATGDK